MTAIQQQFLDNIRELNRTPDNWHVHQLGSRLIAADEAREQLRIALRLEALGIGCHTTPWVPWLEGVSLLGTVPANAAAGSPSASPEATKKP